MIKFFKKTGQHKQEEFDQEQPYVMVFTFPQLQEKMNFSNNQNETTNQLITQNLNQESQVYDNSTVYEFNESFSIKKTTKSQIQNQNQSLYYQNFSSPGIFATFKQNRSQISRVKRKKILGINRISHKNFQYKTPSASLRIKKRITSRIFNKKEDKQNKFNTSQQQYNSYSENNIELIESEEKLIEDINNFKKSFLGSISHELKTPFNSALLLIHILKNNEDIDREIQDNYIFPVYCSMEILNSFISDISDLASLEIGTFQIELSEFSLGSIKIIVDYLEDEDLISISIQDTGCGMTNEEIENILEVMQENSFNLQHYSKNRGIGLGLIYCSKVYQKISQQQKGIDIQSVINMGTTFSFYVKNFNKNNENNKTKYKKVQIFKSEYLDEWIQKDYNKNDKFYSQTDIEQQNKSEPINQQFGQINTNSQNLPQNQESQSVYRLNSQRIKEYMKNIFHSEQSFKSIKSDNYISLNEIELQQKIQETKISILNNNNRDTFSVISKNNSKNEQNSKQQQKNNKKVLQEKYSTGIANSQNKGKGNNIQLYYDKQEQEFSTKKDTYQENQVFDDSNIDDVFTLNSLSMILLTRYQLQVSKANNGLQAVERVKDKYLSSSQELQKHFKLIIMDYDMPQLNGEQASQQIVQFYKKNNIQKNLPFMCLHSAIIDNQNYRIKQYFKQNLNKPVSLTELDKLIDKIFPPIKQH